MAKKDPQQLVKVFIFLFIVSFIIINWNSVSWIFNYREVDGLVSDFFNPYPDTALALVTVNKAEGRLINTQALSMYSDNSNALQISGVAQTKAPQIVPITKDNSLSIPKINVNTAVVIATSTDKTDLAKDLDKGATYYPGSVLPGQDGQMVILGHSAPPNWPHIKHDYIFSDLQNLVAGDQIVLTFNNQQYTYKVVGSKVIQRGEDVPTPEISGNILTLISCWPPGKDYQRITVTAQLVK